MTIWRIKIPSLNITVTFFSRMNLSCMRLDLSRFSLSWTIARLEEIGSLSNTHDVILVAF